MESSSRSALELVIAVLLGLVSVATAVGAYQAASWAGRASEYASIAGELRDRNLTETLSGQLVIKDDGVTMLELVALDSELLAFPDRSADVERRSQTLLDSASPELAQAWDVWVAAGRPADAVPINSVAYESALFARPQSLQYTSFVVDGIADRAGERADRMTVAAVAFAVALLLLGVAGAIAARRRAVALVGAAASALLAGVGIVLSALF